MFTHYELHFSSDRTTNIVSGPIADLLPQLLPSGRVFAIVDAEVEALHNISQLIPETLIIPGGEENKNMQLVDMIWQEMVDSKVDREAFLVGVGGGVLTDLVGFVASTWMRGVRFGLVPTTLLAQIDAAIGGKCAVNVGGYKNMVGTFAPAEFVLCDHAFLKTLPEREMRAGVAEMIKAAVIGDVELFERLEQLPADALVNDRSVFDELVARSVRVKCDIVQRDPYEKGERKLLNLGHTFAHAIESLTEQYSHGEAVAIGLVRASQMAVKMGLMAAEQAERIANLVAKYGLPISSPIDDEQMWEAMSHDKKVADGVVRMILPTTIGKCNIYSINEL